MAAGKNAFELNKQLVDTFIADKDSLKARLDSYFRDENQPFDERWAVFSGAPAELCGRERWGFAFRHPELRNIEWYDDFSIERYEEVDLSDLGERSYFEDEPELWEAAKRELLARNIRTFRHDW